MHQGLQGHARREGIGGAKTRNVYFKVSTWHRQVNAAVAPSELASKLFADPIANCRIQILAVATKKATNTRRKIYTEWRTPIAPVNQLSFLVLIITHRYANTIHDFKGFKYPFLGEIRPGMNLHAAVKFPVIVDVQVTSLLVTVEIPIAAIVHMWAQLLQLPPILRSVAIAPARLVFTKVFSGQKTNFWIKVSSNLGITSIQGPVLVIEVPGYSAGHIITIDPWRLCLRYPTANNSIIADTPAPIDCIGAIDVVILNPINCTISISFHKHHAYR